MGRAWDEPGGSDVFCGLGFAVGAIAFGIWLALALEGSDFAGFNGRGAAITMGAFMLAIPLAALSAGFGLALWRRERSHGTKWTPFVLGVACLAMLALTLAGVALSPAPGI